MPDELTWDEHELLARIAHRWYLDGRTQDAIGREFGLSRPKVQRLLERARATGVVEIHVEPPLGIALGLEGDLVQTFSLTDAIVSSLRADAESQRAGVARSAARYLERRLHDGSVVAVSHGRDIGEVPRFFRPVAVIDVDPEADAGQIFRGRDEGGEEEREQRGEQADHHPDPPG